MNTTDPDHDELEHLRKNVRLLAELADKHRRERDRVLAGLRELRDSMTWSRPAPRLSIDEGQE